MEFFHIWNHARSLLDGVQVVLYISTMVPQDIACAPWRPYFVVEVCYWDTISADVKFPCLFVVGFCFGGARKIYISWYKKDYWSVQLRWDVLLTGLDWIQLSISNAEVVDVLCHHQKRGGEISLCQCAWKCCQDLEGFVQNLFKNVQTISNINTVTR